MKKGIGAPPAKEERRQNNATSYIGVKEYKPFDWFCQNCAQLLTGIYETDAERPDDFPECQSCGLFRGSK